MGTLEQAIVDAIGKMAGRKNGAALVCMGVLYSMQAPTWQVFGVGVLAVGLQFLLDAVEVIRTGRDLPENGNGHGGTDGTDTTDSAGVVGITGVNLPVAPPQG